ncbi:hypothetical protein H7B90_32345 [Cohnella xylanilytica]|uniref:Uncharacterized protein n=1 Tax=Cohnella xylanilytica TaxID=557555 RepID=A0A841UDS4_9BACL|nr:hypothetical protein [Cohnella xylanilytica]MBB6696090.1 hypothetical protein [Cohnella xylanilytica]
MSIEKYAGKSLDIICVDDAGQLAQRRMTPHSAANGRMSGDGHWRRSLRAFKVPNLLPNKPVNGYAS